MSGGAADRMTICDTWEHLAREDPMWFIASLPGKRHGWSTDEFYQTGEANAPWILELIAHPDPSSAVLLELGCGMGRHSFALAHSFRQVIGIDVSHEMIRLAELRRRELGIENVRFVVNDGESLAGVDSDSVDVCFSYLCLQYVPTSRIVRRYIIEMGRVLVRGGVAVFQLPVVPDTTWGTIRHVERSALNFAIRSAVRTLRLAPGRLLVNSPAYRGTRLTSRYVRDAAQQGGLEVIAMTETRRGWRDCYETFVRCRKL